MDDETYVWQHLRDAGTAAWNVVENNIQVVLLHPVTEFLWNGGMLQTSIAHRPLLRGGSPNFFSGVEIRARLSSQSHARCHDLTSGLLYRIPEEESQLDMSS